jgi:hypothetical protein
VIPVFVREGAIITRGDIVRVNNNWDKNWSPKLRLEIFPSGRQSSQFDYYTGDGVRRIKVTPYAGGLTIQLGDLGTSGTLEVYCRKVSGVTKNGTALREGTGYQYDAAAQKLTVPFQGSTALAVRNAGSLF